MPNAKKMDQRWGQIHKHNVTYLFSNNANWKINLKTKAFDKNPYCSCCKTPSHLIRLSPSGVIFPLSEEENHKCINSEKKHYLSFYAYVFAFQDARTKYEVHDKTIEDDMKRLIEEGKVKVKD